MTRCFLAADGAAITFGLLVQMFLPDSKVQQTVQVVTAVKQEDKKKSAFLQNDDIDKNV